ncbi:MAG: hypothetical protein RDV48_11895 [Candidatus Eremiobacteraeota bacterium]|nr:hypothetical protein [Candidatus Eremiobacteraeota bacterium]
MEETERLEKFPPAALAALSARMAARVAPLAILGGAARNCYVRCSIAFALTYAKGSYGGDEGWKRYKAHDEYIRRLRNAIMAQDVAFRMSERHRMGGRYLSPCEEVREVEKAWLAVQKSSHEHWPAHAALRVADSAYWCARGELAAVMAAWMTLHPEDQRWINDNARWAAIEWAKTALEYSGTAGEKAPAAARSDLERLKELQDRSPLEQIDGGPGGPLGELWPPGAGPSHDDGSAFIMESRCGLIIYDYEAHRTPGERLQGLFAQVL